MFLSIPSSKLKFDKGPAVWGNLNIDSQIEFTNPAIPVLCRKKTGIAGFNSYNDCARACLGWLLQKTFSFTIKVNTAKQQMDEQTKCAWRAVRELKRLQAIGH